MPKSRCVREVRCYAATATCNQSRADLLPNTFGLQRTGRITGGPQNGIPQSLDQRRSHANSIAGGRDTTTTSSRLRCEKRYSEFVTHTLYSFGFDTSTSIVNCEGWTAPPCVLICDTTGAVSRGASLQQHCFVQYFGRSFPGSRLCRCPASGSQRTEGQLGPWVRFYENAPGGRSGERSIVQGCPRQALAR